MKNIFNKAWQLMNENLATLIIFQLVYKFMGMIVFLPIVNGILQYAMKQAGLNYLTTQNLTIALQNPMTIAFILILLFFFAFYIYFEISALILLFDCNHKKDKIGLLALFQKAFKKAIAIYKVKNFLLICFTAIIIPTIYLSLTSEVANKVRIPEFILDSITNSWKQFLAFIVINTFFIFIAIRWIFSLHYMVLEPKEIFFLEATKKSKKLLKSGMLKNILFMLGFTLVLLFVIFLLYLLLLLIIMLAIKLSIPGAQAKEVFWDKYEMLKSFMVVLVNIMTSSGIVALVSALFYHNRKEEGNWENGKQKKSKKKIVGVFLSFLIIVFLLDQYVRMNSFDTTYIEHIGLNRKIDITAHRGASNIAPENTMAAIKEAIKLGADFAEIDVQQTKDGTLILIHDTDFKRIAGIDKKVWEMDYDEIKDLDVGSWFSDQYNGEKIATLEQVLRYCSGKIKLNIELKKEKTSEDLAQKVVALLQQTNFQNQCLVSSFGYSILQQVKQLDPQIKTLYNVALGYGEFYTLEHIDAYSVEASSVTMQVVNQIHERGKQIFVWTVNSKNTMKKLIYLGVDNIITDHVLEAKEMVVSKNNTLLQNLVNVVYP